jgi:hypothetical protein
MRLDWFQGVWVQDWVQPKWIVRRSNPLHVCPRSQRPPVSQLNGFYRRTTEAAMAHPTSKSKLPKWVLSLCREMQASIGFQLRTECELLKGFGPRPVCPCGSLGWRSRRYLLTPSGFLAKTIFKTPSCDRRHIGIRVGTVSQAESGSDRYNCECRENGPLIATTRWQALDRAEPPLHHGSHRG